LPETSVIIRTFNEEAHLPELLDGLKQQTYDDYEVVVVDSGSVDRTRDIASPVASKLLRISSHDFTFGYSLNVGIQAAEGKYAAIVSAHMLPVDEHWLGNLVESLGDGQTAMSYGRQVGWNTSKFSEIMDLDRTFGADRRVQRSPDYFAHNANSAIRKELWDQHPFNETIPGLEDIEWARHWLDEGYQVVYDPRASLHHIHEEQWRQVQRRYYREAVAARYLGIRGRRHIFTEGAREVIRTFFDMGHMVFSNKTSDSGNAGTIERTKEIVLFRANKAVGTINGLLGAGSVQELNSQGRWAFDQTCRAVKVTGPGRAALDVATLPEVKPGDVMIRVAYNGICGRDLEVLRGSSGHGHGGRYPFVLGHEISGRVVSVGTNISHLQEGDRVVVESTLTCGNCHECRRSNHMECTEKLELGASSDANGGYSEYVVAPGRFAHPLPPELDLRTAALAEPLSIVLKGLSRLSRFWPSSPEVKNCAVVGAGSLGNFCAQILALRGHRVTVFEISSLRRSYLDVAGIETSEELSRLGEFDVLVDMTGDPEVLDSILEESASGSAVLLLGLPPSYKTFTLDRVVGHDKTIVGSTGSSEQHMKEAIELLPLLKVDQFLNCVLPLEDFQGAWEAFEERRFLKVILKVDGDLSE
jgi:2-desacetyl-2-hydroxyethyl bacteriochlorophyllide A dehydrogenase